MTVSAEGRVENQKLNQTAALLSFDWVFGFQLDSQEKHLITLVVQLNAGKTPRGVGFFITYFFQASLTKNPTLVIFFE